MEQAFNDDAPAPSGNAQNQRHDAFYSKDQHFNHLADAMPSLVWTARADGYRNYFNQRWLDYSGVEIDKLYGYGWLDLVHPDDYERVKNHWAECLKADRPYEKEYRLRRHDGSYEWFISRGVAHETFDEQDVKWYGALTNIDVKIREGDELERLVAERTKQLISTNQELQQSNQELESFAYVASHDLQEPLRKIQAFGNLLSEEYGEQLGDGADYLKRMKAAASRMSVLIEDLLAFSRVTTKAREAQPVDLNKIVDDVLTDMETRINETGGQVNVGDLPQLQADPTHIRQLFQNLISNALKFSQPNIAPIVNVSAETVDDTHTIKVSDNGIGFDQKYADRIFSVFQRLHGRGEYPGTGIGLAICRKIVERYGGTIEANSEKNVGSKFIITLPTSGGDNQHDNG